MHMKIIVVILLLLMGQTGVTLAHEGHAFKSRSEMREHFEEPHAMETNAVESRQTTLTMHVPIVPIVT